METKILLLSSEPTSANFSILLISVRASHPNSEIYYIFKARSETEYRKYKDLVDKGIYYYPYRNAFEERFVRYIQERAMTISTKIINYFYWKLSPCSNMLFYSKFEGQLIKIATNLINKHNIKIIYTSNNPYHAHKVALKISVKHAIIWYQFWFDPFYTSPVTNRFNITNLCKKYLEKKLITAATKILILPEVSRYDPILSSSNKVNIIEVPYIINKSIDCLNFDFIFAGSFVKGIREPEPVFNILAKSIELLDDRIRFIFYVKDRMLYNEVELSSNGRIVFNNYINRDVLDEVLSNAMGLMSVGNINTCQMPSKVVEYIAYRKPILFFYADSQDPSFRYFSKYPNVCFINVNDDVILSVNKLVKFVHQEHLPISYESLLEIELFRKSTPEYIAEVIYK